MEATRNLYRIRFKLRDGSEHTWQRYGPDIEACLAGAKRALKAEYGENWAGGVCISRSN